MVDRKSVADLEFGVNKNLSANGSREHYPHFNRIDSPSEKYSIKHAIRLVYHVPQFHSPYKQPVPSSQQKSPNSFRATQPPQPSCNTPNPQQTYPPSRNTPSLPEQTSLPPPPGHVDTSRD